MHPATPSTMHPSLSFEALVVNSFAMLCSLDSLSVSSAISARGVPLLGSLLAESHHLRWQDQSQTLLVELLLASSVKGFHSPSSLLPFSPLTTSWASAALVSSRCHGDRSPTRSPSVPGAPPDTRSSGLSPAWSNSKIGGFATETTSSGGTKLHMPEETMRVNLINDGLARMIWQALHFGCILTDWRKFSPKMLYVRTDHPKYWDWITQWIKGPLALGKRQAPPICRTACQKPQIQSGKV